MPHRHTAMKYSHPAWETIGLTVPVVEKKVRRSGVASPPPPVVCFAFGYPIPPPPAPNFNVDPVREPPARMENKVRRHPALHHCSNFEFGRARRVSDLVFLVSRVVRQQRSGCVACGCRLTFSSITGKGKRRVGFSLVNFVNRRPVGEDLL